MKKVIWIISILIIVIVSRLIGGFIGNIDGERIASRNNMESFLNEFVINNENYKYPIKINDSTYLTKREMYYEGDDLFIIESYKLNAPMNVSDTELQDITETTREEVRLAFCSTSEEKDNLFRGYSEVGIIQKIHDMHGNIVMDIKIKKSNC